MSVKIDPIETLGEIHAHTQAMLVMLQTYLVSTLEGGDEISEQALSDYVWQIQTNLDRAQAATLELSKEPK